jgi:hypothetical protein
LVQPAVVSSQAFTKRVGELEKKHGELTDEDKVSLRRWLSNGLGEAVGDFITRAAGPMEGAAYHLDDEIWVVPAMLARTKSAELVIDWKKV